MKSRVPRVAGPAENPLYHMIAYGLANPTVLWCIERGVYDEFCHGKCQGKGFYGRRPCGCIDSAIPDPDTGKLCACSRDEPCRHCRTICPDCWGTGVKRDRPLCAADFGDEASLAVARIVAPATVNAAMRDSQTWGSSLR